MMKRKKSEEKFLPFRLPAKPADAERIGRIEFQRQGKDFTLCTNSGRLVRTFNSAVAA